MAADQAQVEAALRTVEDPELGLTLGTLGFVRSVRARRRKVHVEVALPVAAWPGLDELAEAIHHAALGVPGVEEMDLEFVVMSDDERLSLRNLLRADMVAGPDAAPDGDARDEHDHDHDHGQGHGHGHGREAGTPAFLAPEASTRVIGVSSGKGGVGKSTVTVNLAIALARAGHRVGLLDADVYGFSVPKMLGADHDPVVIGDIVLPTAAHGVKCLSMGYFVPDDQPVIWRGPMLHKAIQQFLTDAYWGEPDFVLVDMPPGTGDVALDPGRGHAQGRDRGGHHSAAGGPARRPALGLRGQAAEALGARGDREHELVHRRRRHPLRAVRLGGRRHAGGGPRGAASRPGATRARGAPGR